MRVKKLIFGFALLTFFLTTSSCEKSYEAESSSTLEATAQDNDNFVELALAKDIGGKISFTTKGSTLNGKQTEGSPKTVESVHELKNKSKKTAFYVINYNEGGWVLLSADKRTDPILGYSDENKFVIDEEHYPPSLQFWLNDAKKQIREYPKVGH